MMEELFYGVIHYNTRPLIYVVFAPARNPPRQGGPTAGSCARPLGPSNKRTQFLLQILSDESFLCYRYEYLPFEGPCGALVQNTLY